MRHIQIKVMDMTDDPICKALGHAGKVSALYVDFESGDKFDCYHSVGGSKYHAGLFRNGQTYLLTQGQAKRMTRRFLSQLFQKPKA